MHGQLRDVAAGEMNAPFVAAHEPDDHVESRRFAGTIWTEQPNDLAALDGQAQVLDDLTSSVALRHAERFEAAHRGGSGAAAPSGSRRILTLKPPSQSAEPEVTRSA